MGMFDTFDEEAKIGKLPQYKGGTYFVLITDTAERDDEWKILKIMGVILAITANLGAGNEVGEEVEHGIFKKKKDKFFERDTRAYYKAGKNLDLDTANAASKEEIGNFLLPEEGKAPIIGRVLEIKVQEVERQDPEEQAKKGSIPRITPLRWVSKDEVTAAVPAKVLARLAPGGIKSPKVKAAPAPAAEE